jgi:hypothetical protein
MLISQDQFFSGDATKSETKATRLLKAECRLPTGYSLPMDVTLKQGKPELGD